MAPDRNSRNSRLAKYLAAGFVALLLAVSPVASKQTLASSGLEVNPWGCFTQADSPHASGHYPGTAAALATHACAGYRGPNLAIGTYPDTQSLKAWLYYYNCVLIFCGWNQVDYLNTGSISGSVLIKLTLTVSANCNNGNSTQWRLAADGTSYGFNGSSYQTYASHAESYATFACGR